MQVYSDLLVSSNLYPTFIYHTGLCMSIKGAENFATSLPTPDKEGRACYSKTATILNRGDVWPLSITLFELYPSFNNTGPVWTTDKQKLSVDQGSAVQDLVVLDSAVEITDVVSGSISPSTFTYSDLLYSDTLTFNMASPALNYSITAAMPLSSPPYAQPFTVEAVRNSPEGAAQVSYTAFIPILGTVPSEVPNFYPVTTDPTLIFLILRDPPGGTSHTKIEAGSVFTTGISIKGMKTYEEEELKTYSNEAIMLKTAAVELEGPIGFGAYSDDFKSDNQVGIRGTLVAPDVFATRTSDTHFSYTFKFRYDFSTSSAANSAGHPSDVIIGGGIDVIASDAVEGKDPYLLHVSKSLFHSLC